MRTFARLILTLLALPAWAAADEPLLSDRVSTCDRWNEVSVAEKNALARKGTLTSVADLGVVLANSSEPKRTEYLEALHSCLVDSEGETIEIWNEACSRTPYPTYAELLEAVGQVTDRCLEDTKDLFLGLE